MQNLSSTFINSAIKRLLYYKELGDKTFAVLETKDFHFAPNEESNSIAVIIQHMAGNMHSRWTDFLTTDGEKEWRNRDTEFESDNYRMNNATKEQLIESWEKGWACCLGAIKGLTDDDLMKTIYIRGEALSVVDAINRQLAHYPYHVGQIIYLAKIINNKKWESLSIPRNKSNEFSAQKKAGK
jgi:Protein of unknown function (DUF1572)